MTEINNEEQHIVESKHSAELLRKSAALKKKTALLKEQMDATSKEVDKVLHADKQHESSMEVPPTT